MQRDMLLVIKDERIKELEDYIKLVLPFIPDGTKAKLGYEVLGMDEPPLRKLKGKAPSYQEAPSGN